MTSTTFRPATLDDVTEVLAFWARAAENSSRPVDDRSAVEELLRRDPEALILAITDGHVVGSLISGWDGWRAHLYRLAVDPGHRRQGIGRRLVAAAEERFRGFGAVRADAMVLDGNVEAHGTWAAFGYAPQPDWSRWVKPL